MGLSIQHVSPKERRARKSKGIIKRSNLNRLLVHKSLQHIYAQIIAPTGKILASASTLDKKLRGAKKELACNINSAKVVGAALAERAVKAGVSKVAFDRAGYKYHGRVKALADAAREGGLEF